MRALRRNINGARIVGLVLLFHNAGNFAELAANFVDDFFRDIGDRASVFDDRPPFAVYAPDGGGVRIVGRSAAEIGVASAPAEPVAAACEIGNAAVPLTRSVAGLYEE